MKSSLDFDQTAMKIWADWIMEEDIPVFIYEVDSNNNETKRQVVLVDVKRALVQLIVVDWMTRIIRTRTSFYSV